MKFSIATGQNRWTKRWKNQEWTWEELLKRLRTTTRTRETLSEYMKMPKTDQDRIKDVGGFVGGYVKNGRRIAGNITKRQLVTLDADFGTSELLPMLDLLYGGNNYAVYSTHKHTPEKPRLRVVLPLSAPVDPDAYQAVARRIAADIGIDMFDDTTYEPGRLMYWPSTAADGDYYFYENAGEYIDPQTVLDLYDDWKDSSAWPVSSRQMDVFTRAAKKQGDPLEKPGSVGAFCRTYTISEAIETYLPDRYVACDKPGRYTYTQGSTAAGLVLYEDGKFAYSHHGTDPVSGRLVNAFDLVRLHLFRDLDEDAKADARVNDLPSYKAMCDLVAKDDAVKAEEDQNRLEKVKEYFDTDEPIDTEWMAALTRDKRNQIESTPGNVKRILENDPNLIGRIAYNEFNFRYVLLDDMPWRGTSAGQVWTDADASCLRNYLSAVYGVQGRQIIEDACAEVFMRRRFHPVRDYIKSLEWDGRPRCETLWIDYLGAEDNKYVRTVTKKHLVAAVSRVFKPGCKFDYVIVLSGPQGIGKSTMIARLGRSWFSDSITTVSGKEAYEQLHGVWIAELGELYATKKAETEAVKSFLSKTEDMFRVAYGRYTSVFPRQCVFYGSTNDSTFLRDRTGNRRFWPIDVGQNEHPYDLNDFTSELVDQIWAEAYQLYLGGESIYIDSKIIEEMARNVQEAHTELSEKRGVIQEYLETLLPDNWESLDLFERRGWLEEDSEKGTIERDRVCVLEVWCEALGGDPKTLTGMMSREINNILRSFPEWEEKKTVQRFGKLYGRQRGFSKKSPQLKDVLGELDGN